jgi:hypothetical protein
MILYNFKEEKNTGSMDEIEDSFIKYNYELKALKLAFRKLKTKINEKMLEAARNFCRGGESQILLLGRRHCALLLLIVERLLDQFPELEVGNFDSITNVLELKLWGMPIYVSMQDDYRIEIIYNLGEAEDEGNLWLRSDSEKGLGKESLVNMEALIKDLPDHMKLKKV